MSELITPEMRDCMKQSVLCWLATADRSGVPNVSPKEMFTAIDSETLLIANLLSPMSVKNIRANPFVCVSFVDVFVQKGFKVKGRARVVDPGHPDFLAHANHLTRLYSDKWPIKAVIEIKVTSVARITAPSYVLFPETTTEESQVASAMRSYGVRPAD